MEPVRQGRGAGVGFIGVGVAFIAIATTGGQPAFLGVGLAFLALGIGAMVRRRGGPR